VKITAAHSEWRAIGAEGADTHLDPGPSGKPDGMVLLSAGITTCLFDLDGVLTQTAKIHARAWRDVR
jgi:hypothetical protein